MSTIKFAEVQLFRFRALKLNVTSNPTVYWDPLNEGSYLSLSDTDGNGCTINFTWPTVDVITNPNGLIIRVDFYQGDLGGGATITWPATFKFQTAGDAIPNSSYQFLTAWEGIVWPGASTVMLMTKFGEWDLS